MLSIPHLQRNDKLTQLERNPCLNTLWPRKISWSSPLWIGCRSLVKRSKFVWAPSFVSFIAGLASALSLGPAAKQRPTEAPEVWLWLSIRLGTGGCSWGLSQRPTFLTPGSPSKSSRNCPEQWQLGPHFPSLDPHPNYSRHGPKELDPKPIFLPYQNTNIGKSRPKVFESVRGSYTKLNTWHKIVHPPWSPCPRQDRHL